MTKTATRRHVTKAPPDPADKRASLAQRKVDLNNLIESETLRRAAAALDDEVFDPQVLRAAQDDLAAVEGAEQELERRTQAEADKAQAVERNTKCKRLRVVLKDWLKGIEEQEAAARKFADAAGNTETARAEVQRLLYELTGSTPSQLLAGEQEARRFRDLSALLHAYKRSHALANDLWFGGFDLRPFGADPAASWSTAEKAVAETIETTIKEIEQ